MCVCRTGVHSFMLHKKGHWLGSLVGLGPWELLEECASYRPSDIHLRTWRIYRISLPDIRYSLYIDDIILYLIYPPKVSAWFRIYIREKYHDIQVTVRLDIQMHSVGRTIEKHLCHSRHYSMTIIVWPNCFCTGKIICSETVLHRLWLSNKPSHIAEPTGSKITSKKTSANAESAGPHSAMAFRPLASSVGPWAPTGPAHGLPHSRSDRSNCRLGQLCDNRSLSRARAVHERVSTARYKAVRGGYSNTIL